MFAPSQVPFFPTSSFIWYFVWGKVSSSCTVRIATAVSNRPHVRGIGPDAAVGERPIAVRVVTAEPRRTRCWPATGDRTNEICVADPRETA